MTQVLSSEPDTMTEYGRDAVTHVTCAVCPHNLLMIWNCLPVLSLSFFSRIEFFIAQITTPYKASEILRHEYSSRYYEYAEEWSRANGFASR